jgi:hypothetical protein
MAIELERSLSDRDLPILIGVDSCEEVRADEYLLSSNDLYLAHENTEGNPATLGRGFIGHPTSGAVS